MESISSSFWSAKLVPSDGQVGDRTNRGGKDIVSALREPRGWVWRNTPVRAGPDKARGERALAERQREGGMLHGSQEGTFEVAGGDRQVTATRRGASQQRKQPSARAPSAERLGLSAAR